MLRNWPIRTKLLVSLLGPLLVLAVLALVGIRQNQAESDRAERSTAFARLAAGLAPLIHELQAERSLSISYLDSGRRRWGRQLATQRRAVDQEAATYRANAQRLSADDELLAEKIEYGLSELGRIGEQRQAIDGARIDAAELAVGPSIELHEEEGEEELEHATKEGHGPLDTPGKALDQYTDTISDLLDINGEIAPRSNNAELLKGVAASVALARAKDFADSQRSLLENVYAANRFQGDEHARLSALVAAETVYTAQFDASATEAQHELLEETVAGPEVERVDTFVERALDSKSATAPKLGIKPQYWFEAMSVKLDRMRVVEERLSADVIATSTAVKQGADRRAWLYSLLLAAALVLAVALALITARSLIRPVRRLEAAAEETAERRLPGVVQRLQDGEQVDLAAESAPPIEVRSSDEIGHLAEAFNSVHRVAVRVAGREAALRRSVGDMFLNLARRSQSLIERQLEVIDELEASGSEAEVRAGLGELDHLATRMRRNAENLIILSGSEPARRWRGPISLTEVVQASIEEVKEHTRVELLPGPGGGGRARRRRRDAPAGRVDRERRHLLRPRHQGAGRRPAAALRVPAGDRGPGPRHDRRAAGQGQPAPGQAAGHRLRPGQDARLLRGHPAGLQARHQGPAAALLVRGHHRPGAAAAAADRDPDPAGPRGRPGRTREPGPVAGGGRGRPPAGRRPGAVHRPRPGLDRHPGADGACAPAPPERLPGRLGAGRADQLAAHLVAGAAVQDQEGVGVEAGLAVGRA